MTDIRLTLTSEAETQDLAAALAPELRSGDVLLLDGPIGAGKTFFARALIQARLRAAGIVEDVPSPTFTLVQTYDDGICEIWHADLYRLGSLGEVVELGLDEAFDTSICIVEWPEKLGAMKPADSLHLAFSAGAEDTERQLVITAPERWMQRLNGLGVTRLAG